MHTSIPPDTDLRSEKYILILVSVLTTGVTLTLTGYASYISNSVTLLADFLKCFVEFLAILVAFVVVEKTRRSDTTLYNYGFGKLEQLSSTIVALTMFCSALLCFGTGLERAVYPKVVTNAEFGLILATLSVLGNGFMWLRFRSLARSKYSPVIASQRSLFLSKTLASAVVTASLSLSSLAAMYPIFLYTDAAGSFFIAFFLMHSAFTIASDSVGDLVDRSIDEAFQVTAMAHIVRYEEAFRGFHGMRTRRVGDKKMIQIHLSFDAQKTFGKATKKLAEMRSAIEKDIPDSEVVIALVLTPGESTT